MSIHAIIFTFFFAISCTTGLHIWRPLKDSRKKKSKPAGNSRDETEDVTVMQKKL